MVQEHVYQAVIHALPTITMTVVEMFVLQSMEPALKVSMMMEVESNALQPVSHVLLGLETMVLDKNVFQ